MNWWDNLIDRKLKNAHKLNYDIIKTPLVDLVLIKIDWWIMDHKQKILSKKIDKMEKRLKL